MKVEVIYALPRGARTARLELPAGATLRDALVSCGFRVDLEKQAFGVFGRRAALDHPLAEGDRVEIYRPLAVDPKEARRRRAREGPKKAGEAPKKSSPRRRGSSLKN